MKKNKAPKDVPLKFREAVKEDLDKLIKLLHDDPLGQTREELSDMSTIKYQEAFEIIMKDNNAHLIVASLNSEVVGMAQINYLTYLTYQGGTRAQIEGVRVDKECRGKGIGKKLIEHIIKLSVENGCHLVQLTTNKQRPDAIRFYETLGFISTHEGMKLEVVP